MHGGCSLRMGGMSTLWTKHERFHGKGPEQQTHLPCARALVPKPKQSRVGGWRMKMLSMGLSMGTLKCEPAVLEPQWHRASSHIQICANDQQAGQPTQIMYMLRVLTRSVSYIRTLPPMPALGVDGCARAPLHFKHQVGAKPIGNKRLPGKRERSAPIVNKRARVFIGNMHTKNSLTAVTDTGPSAQSTQSIHSSSSLSMATAKAVSFSRSACTSRQM